MTQQYRDETPEAWAQNIERLRSKVRAHSGHRHLLRWWLLMQVVGGLVYLAQTAVAATMARPGPWW